MIIEDLYHMANEGDAESQYLLAQAFDYGIRVKKNWDIADYWYKKASDQGHVWASFRVRREKKLPTHK